MESIIKVENLSKRYRIGSKANASRSLGSAVFSWLKAPFSNLADLKKLSSFNEKEEEDVIWALKNVSFDVNEGEVMGIIGKNGAGKSTLLKILSRITDPSEGRFVMHGRVASLLEVGTGFHQDLTGRENIFMNGTILGMKRKEIAKRFDEIVSFSGVEKFIDTPIKRYSSGMKVRLAFAVAANLEPEILIIDEVLAVGDAEFQKKCLGKMKDISDHGKTILFVSHNMASVHELCSTCALIQGGKLVMKATPSETIKYYLDTTQIGCMHTGENLSAIRRDHPDYGKKVIIDSFKLKSPNFYWKQPVEFEFSVTTLDKSVGEIEFGFGIDGSSGIRICTFESEKSYDTRKAEKINFHVKLYEPKFVPASYYITLGLRSGMHPLDVLENVAKFDVLDVDASGAHFGFTQGVTKSGYIDTKAEVNTG